MSRLQHIFTAILLLISFHNYSLASELVNKNETVRIGFQSGYSNVGSFYNSNGKSVNEIESVRSFSYYDSENNDTIRTAVGRESFEFTDISATLIGEFKINDDLYIESSLQSNLFQLNTTFTFVDTLLDEDGNIIRDPFDRVAQRERKMDAISSSKLMLTHITGGAKYYFINSNDKFSVSSVLKVPLSFESEGIATDSVFLSDNTLQLLLGAFYTKKMDNIRFNLGFYYNIRDGVYSDQYDLRAEMLFTKIEDSEIFVKLNYIRSIDTPPSDYKFEILEFPIYESYLSSEFGMNLRFDTNEIGISYKFIPIGENYWNKNRVSIIFNTYIK